ncbi:MAG: hypothetical protein HYY30_04345 [Chloroflexi bacterium]|nr:hypothetical protein [Chloroflexota bacterium]
MSAIAETERVGSFPHNLTKDDRDNEWLNAKLDFLWNTYFSDVARVNHVKIEFGKRWKGRLGMITLSASGSTTYIAVNSLLRSRQAPYFVPTITVAHELVHYAHGFGSPLPRRYAHPHQGGVVAKDLAERGLGNEHRLYRKWLAEHWYDFYGRATSPIRRVSSLPVSVQQSRG